uniref:Uncharacterized protein LOC111132848 isoform X4 n=1 Tax=Crassostrea virginica TaxID=6565 RepID=A0A8B8E8G1_CRAVI|nr:uncharacterized protein LOC111132848 isoform X4 [Crassostrea virginica]XP_022336431.1 uncharacterized protein LOC111132848 isoform X4 [Crassostrea virginica]
MTASNIMRSVAVRDTRFSLLMTFLIVYVTSTTSTTANISTTAETSTTDDVEVSSVQINTTGLIATTQGQNDDLIKQLQPFVIMSGVALLLLLLLCNFISVLQRRKYHRVIQRDFLTLHALLPLFRHYDDIDGPRRYAKGRKDPTIEEYDEIGMFIRGSKVECKRNSSVRNSLKTPDRNTVYSLQKEVLSTDF